MSTRPFINDFLEPYDENNPKRKVYVDTVPADETIGDKTDEEYVNWLEDLSKMRLKGTTGYDLPVKVTVCSTNEPNMVSVVTVVDIPESVIENMKSK